MADNVVFSTAVNAYKRANQGEQFKGASGAPVATMPEQNQASDRPSFSRLVGDALRTSASTGYKSEEVSTRAIANEADLHELVTTVANAELTLNTVVAVRDRVVSAYQDIIKMPI